jgi:hypothetical protein
LAGRHDLLAIGYELRQVHVSIVHRLRTIVNRSEVKPAFNTKLSMAN